MDLPQPPNDWNSNPTFWLELTFPDPGNRKVGGHELRKSDLREAGKVVGNRSSDSLALATGNVYGHMYCGELTSDNLSPAISAPIWGFDGSSVFHSFALHLVNGERQSPKDELDDK
jgi:hypothetical protein